MTKRLHAWTDRQAHSKAYSSLHPSLPILLAVVQQPKLSALATLICTLQADKGVGGQILREHKLALLLMATSRAVLGSSGEEAWSLCPGSPLPLGWAIPEHHAGLSPAAPQGRDFCRGPGYGGASEGSFLFSHKDKTTITSGRSQSPTCSQLGSGGGTTGGCCSTTPCCPQEVFPAQCCLQGQPCAPFTAIPLPITSLPVGWPVRYTAGRERGDGSSSCIDKESCLNQQPASLNLNPSSPGTGSP